MILKKKMPIAINSLRIRMIDWFRFVIALECLLLRLYFRNILFVYYFYLFMYFFSNSAASVAKMIRKTDGS